MLSIEAKLDRARRLVRMLEEDAPLLARRVAELTPEHQRSAKTHAAELMQKARAEVRKLKREAAYWDPRDPTPWAAD